MDATPHQDFLKWYQPLHEGFTRFCSSHALGVMETEDLVQESLLAVLQSFHRVADKEHLLFYLFSIAKNIVKNKKRRLKFIGTWDDRMIEKLESRINDPELALDVHFLHKAIEKLPEKQKDALILFEISGFSIKEIASIQECSIPALKTRLSRSRQKLKELLSEEASTRSFGQRLAVYSSILF